MGTQISNLRNKIESLGREAAQYERHIDEQNDEIEDVNKRLKEVQDQRESLQRQYNGFAQSFISVQEELANCRALG